MLSRSDANRSSARASIRSLARAARGSAPVSLRPRGTLPRARRSSRRSYRCRRRGAPLAKTASVNQPMCRMNANRAAGTASSAAIRTWRLVPFSDAHAGAGLRRAPARTRRPARRAQGLSAGSSASARTRRDARARTPTPMGPNAVAPTLTAITSPRIDQRWRARSIAGTRRPRARDRPRTRAGRPARSAPATSTRRRSRCSPRSEHHATGRTTAPPPWSRPASPNPDRAAGCR